MDHCCRVKSVAVHTYSVDSDSTDLPRSLALEKSVDGKIWELVKLWAEELDHGNLLSTGRSLADASTAADSFVLKTNSDQVWLEWHCTSRERLSVPGHPRAASLFS